MENGSENEPLTKEQRKDKIKELETVFDLPHPENLDIYGSVIDVVQQSNIEDSAKEIIKTLLNTGLGSKQANEPYEHLLSQLLGLRNNEQKHGFDATSNDNMEEYEYKPTKNKSGTINDDSFKKIEKCEILATEGKKGWLILAFINSDIYSFDMIYKFPLEIYNNCRRDTLIQLNIKNNNKKDGENKTRSTFNITVPKSQGLCVKYNTPYYVWKRNNISETPITPP
jgi:hypothetical protein